MFTQKKFTVEKSILKIADSKKDSPTRLRHLKSIIDNVDIEEAKSIFETNYSHVYYILYDTFVQAEINLKQRVHKAHREELDNSLWLLGKILCLLPELIARRWQVHSLSRVLSKLLHHGNSTKLRKEGVRFFLLWYQALGDNAPELVHSMFTELVPGLTIPLIRSTVSGGATVIVDTEFVTNDLSNHPNLKGEIGASVFHDTASHPVKSPDITPLLSPATNERTAAPDPKDGLEILLECMVQSSGCLKWRENSPQKHMRCFSFLLQRFCSVYLPVFCPNFDYSMSIYDPRLDVPAMRTVSKREELMSSCIVVMVNWIARYTHERSMGVRLDHLQIDDDTSSDTSSLMSNLRQMGYTQMQLVRDVLYSTRENVNFVHEIFRQAFLLNFTSKSQIEAMRIAIGLYKEWMSTNPPPFLLEPLEEGAAMGMQEGPKNQRLRTDSYLGAITKENFVVRAGLQNVLQVFVTNAVNVFMVQTGHLSIHFQTKSKDLGYTTPLDEQTEICKRVLNIYRTMVMKTRMNARTWEQLLQVLLQITSTILINVAPNAKKSNLGGRLAQPVFQTLIVTWIRAHTNVVVNATLWDRFLKVLGSLTHREELIVEWDKTMQTLTRVLARQVYNLNLQDLPLDRLAVEAKGGKRRRIGLSSGNQGTTSSSMGGTSNTPSTPPPAVSITSKGSNNSGDGLSFDDDRLSTQRTVRLGESHMVHTTRSVPGTPYLNRSYSEGSLAALSFRKSRVRRKHKAAQQMSALPSNVEDSLQKLMMSPHLSVSSETMNFSRISCGGNIGSFDTVGSGTLRRAISLDSVKPGRGQPSSRGGSRSPSPTASSGLEGNGSIKDSPLQIDMMTGGDSSSIDTSDEISLSADRRSILAGGTARGWLPDVAAVMWRRMLGALGDVNKILNPKLHAQVFKYLVQMTESLIKIKMNQGISCDNLSTPAPPTVVPPIALVAPWCFGAFALDTQYNNGKLYAMQLLCTIVRNGGNLGSEQYPLFYHILHQALTGEDRAITFTALRYLGGSKFLSLLLPGHTLLLLDLVHASTVVLTSSDCSALVPRAEVTSLLGSLLCFPKTSLPGPVLQPSGSIVDLMECPDLQEHVLNILLRCARREPTARARCIAISVLGQWVLQNLTTDLEIKPADSHRQQVPLEKVTPQRQNPRIAEAIQVILQALQFKHRCIARVAAETLKLCAEKGKEISRIDRLVPNIVVALCTALEIQNVTNPKEADKVVINALLLCLGEFCMHVPTKMLLLPKSVDSQESLILIVLQILYRIAVPEANDGHLKHTRIKLFATDEDFDMSVSVDDVRDGGGASEANYQTAETIQQCIAAIQLCAKTVAMHLVTNLGHFPIGIGASRLSSLVDEQDDLNLKELMKDSTNTRESIDLSPSQVLSAPNLQFFMLSNDLVASLIELPTLRLPGGGITAGFVTANRQVRILLRDLNGKSCWDAAILYMEPKTSSQDATDGDTSTSAHYLTPRHTTFQYQNDGNRNFMVGMGASMDTMLSTVGLPTAPLRHTMRHRPPHQLPVAKDIAPDLDQLDDLLQYIGHTSPECLETGAVQLNSAGRSPLSGQLEAQTISIILNQKAIANDYLSRQNIQNCSGYFSGNISNVSQYSSFDDTPRNSITSSTDGVTLRSHSKADSTLPFKYCRLLFSQLGLAGWERRRRTHLLNRTDKLLRELRNLDAQKCRETHKMAVIYVANGQEDKHSILRNSCGSSTYEMFVSALGWEIELESHNGFLGGLPRQGCGSTAPYFATPFLEVIYHVATRMPSDNPESVLNKTRHLGNDEVHIVWSEHNREYRRDILPTEFCDVLIVIYPLKSGLFRITLNKKAEVPWFGPLYDEAVVGGTCLASLVRATAINASRAKRTSLPFYQQFYEERNRSLGTVASRHKENTTFEDFIARVFSPIATSNSTITTTTTTTVLPQTHAPLASALIDHRSSTKNWLPHPKLGLSGRESTQHTISITGLKTSSLDPGSPRPAKKLHHPFKKYSSTPDSPTLASARRFKY